jgi:hypothetical protein
MADSYWAGRPTDLGRRDANVAFVRAVFQGEGLGHSLRKYDDFTRVHITDSLGETSSLQPDPGRK